MKFEIRTLVRSCPSGSRQKLFAIANDFEVHGPRYTTTARSKIREIQKKFDDHVLITG